VCEENENPQRPYEVQIEDRFLKNLAFMLAISNLPGQQTPVQPVLQRQDGNFIGTVSTSARGAP
jgi:hypothetical protein